MLANRKNKSFSVILLIAGSGKRFGTNCPKQYQMLSDKPVWVWSALTLYNMPCCTEMIIVCNLQYEKQIAADLLCFGMNERSHLIAGGETRQDSVLNGCLFATREIVIIHDGARPFVPESVTDACNLMIDATDDKQCVALGIPVTDTLRNINSLDTVNREELWKMQTPQLAYRKQLIRALQHCKSTGTIVTDDLAAMNEIGCKMKFVQGSSKNIKITNREDFVYAEYIVKELLGK